MRDHPKTPPYPTEEELEATKASAIVASLILLTTGAVAVALFAIELMGVQLAGWSYPAVLVGEVVVMAVSVAVIEISTHHPTGPQATAHTYLSSLDAAERIRDDIETNNQKETQ